MLVLASRRAPNAGSAFILKPLQHGLHLDLAHIRWLEAFCSAEGRVL